MTLQTQQAQSQEVRLGSMWQQLHTQNLRVHEDPSGQKHVLGAGKNTSSRKENTSLSAAARGLREDFPHFCEVQKSRATSLKPHGLLRAEPELRLPPPLPPAPALPGGPFSPTTLDKLLPSPREQSEPFWQEEPAALTPSAQHQKASINGHVIIF